MLIELGPTPLLRRGTDWKAVQRHDGSRYVAVQYVCFLRYGVRHYQSAAAMAVRRYGFVLGDFNTITNWDDVPHLWEPSDVD